MPMRMFRIIEISTNATAFTLMILRLIEIFRRCPFLTRDDLNNHIDRSLFPTNLLAVSICPKPAVLSVNQCDSIPIVHLPCTGARLLDRCRLWYDVHPGAKTAWLWGAQRDIPSLTPLDHLRARFKRHRFLKCIRYDRCKNACFCPDACPMEAGFAQSISVCHFDICSIYQPTLYIRHSSKAY